MGLLLRPSCTPLFLLHAAAVKKVCAMSMWPTIHCLVSAFACSAAWCSLIKALYQLPHIMGQACGLVVCRIAFASYQCKACLLHTAIPTNHAPVSSQEKSQAMVGD